MTPKFRVKLYKNSTCLFISILPQSAGGLEYFNFSTNIYSLVEDKTDKYKKSLLTLEKL